jgi:hypothetical protein
MLLFGLSVSEQLRVVAEDPFGAKLTSVLKGGKSLVTGLRLTASVVPSMAAPSSPISSRVDGDDCLA